MDQDNINAPKSCSKSSLRKHGPGLQQSNTLQALAALTGSLAYFTMPLTGPAHRRKEKEGCKCDQEWAA